MIESAEYMVISAGTDIAYRIEIGIICDNSHQTCDTRSYKPFIKDIGLCKTCLALVSKLDIVHDYGDGTLGRDVILAGETCKRIYIIS